MDSGSGSRDGKEGGEKTGKTAAKAGTKTPPREPRRGQGIARLEADRIQNEMEGNQQPPAFSGPVFYGLEWNRPTMNPQPPSELRPYSIWRPSGIEGTVVASNRLPSYQPAAYYGRGSMPYWAHRNSSTIAYGPGGGGGTGYYNFPLIIRPPDTSDEATSSANPSIMAPTALSLFKETPDHHKGGKSAYSKGEEGHNHSGESTSKDSNDKDDLDLDLKL